MRLQEAVMFDRDVLIVRGGELPVDRGRVVERVDPDIVVLQTDADSVADIARASRFAISRAPDGSMQTFGDESVLDELNDGARLFMEAWRTRPLSKPNRPGEGLAWDAPGFEPPDRPSR
jgi:hypothetical protein